MRKIRPSFIEFPDRLRGDRDCLGRTPRPVRADPEDRSPLDWLNFVYLFPLSLLPFGAALVARYESEPAALSLYGGLMLLIALTRLVVWLYATNRPHLLYKPIDRRVKTIRVLIVASRPPSMCLRSESPARPPVPASGSPSRLPSCTSSPCTSVARSLPGRGKEFT